MRENTGPFRTSSDSIRPGRRHLAFPHPSPKSRKTAHSRFKAFTKEITVKRLLLVVGSCLLAAYVFRQATQSTVILDPIEVPKQLSDAGFTSRVITERVKQKIEEIEKTDEFASTKQQVAMAGDKAVPDIEIPETKLSLQTVSDIVRKLLGNEPAHLSGEIVMSSGNGGTEVRTWMHPAHGDTRASLPQVIVAGNMEQAVESVASGVTELADPYLVGIYLRGRRQMPEGMQVAGRMLLSASDTDHIYEKAHLLRGFLYEDASDPDHAIAEARIAVQMDPKWPYSIHCLALLLDDRGDSAAVEEYAKEIAMNSRTWTYRVARWWHPEFSIPPANLGYLLLSLNRLREAHDAFRQALRIDSKCSFCYTGLGDLSAAEHKNVEAEENYRRALKIDPMDASAHTHLADFLWTQQNTNEAEYEFLRALQLDPQSVNAHRHLGNMFSSLRRFAEAAFQLGVDASLEPTSAPVHREFADALFDAGRHAADPGADFVQAENEYRAALTLDPKDATTASNLADLLRYTQRTVAAMGMYQRAIDLDDRHTDAYNGIGNILLDARKLGSAEAQYRRSIAIDPNYAPGHANLGNVLSDRRKMVEAEAEYRLALKLDPNLVFVHRALAALLNRQSRVAEADQERKIADRLAADGY